MKKQALVATLWSAGDTLLRQGLPFVTTVVLARLLSPADFGLLAMLSLFIGVAGILADGGLSVALIQREEIHHADESTVFYFNLALGIVLALLLASTAPLIAAFFREPQLAPVAQVVSLSIVANAAGSIHFALLARKLDFRRQSLAGGAAAALSGGIAIALALQGYGVWALVAQTVVMTSTTTTLLWIMHPWRPARTFQRESLRKLFSFGGFQLLSSLIDAGYSRLHTLLIGHRFGAGALGYYTTAENTRQLPASFVGGLVARVALPMLSHARGEPALVRRGLQLAIRVMMLLYAPVMLALATFAGPVVEALYGPQWRPSATLLIILAVAGLLYPLHLINVQALLALGQSRLMLRVELLKKGLGLVLLLAGAMYGLAGIAWSQLLHSFLALAINAHYAGRWFGYGPLAQLRDAFPPMAVAALATLCLLLVAGEALEQPSPARLLTALTTTGIGYLALHALLRTQAWREALSLVAQLRPNGARHE